MFVEINAPCSLPLGLARLDPASAKLAWVSASLQYPPIELRAQANPAGLAITGPRAHIAHRYAERFAAHRPAAAHTELQIEWAIPSHMGLGADSALGLAAARALAWTAGEAAPDTASLAHALGLSPDEAPAAWGAAQGGVLLVDAESPAGAWPAVLRRGLVTHADQDDDWVVILVLPRTPDGTPADLEARRLAAVRGAAPYLSAETGRLVQERLFPALERDDFAAFAGAWRDLAALNAAALAQTPDAPAVEAETRATLEVMRAEGAAVFGRSPAGLALFGLVRGVSASQTLRKALRAHVGHFGGTISASLLSPAGAVLTEQPGELTRTAPPIQMAHPIP